MFGLLQRQAGNTSVIMVAGQEVARGRIHAHTVMTVSVADTTRPTKPGDNTRTVSRTTPQAVRSIHAHRPRQAAL